MEEHSLPGLFKQDFHEISHDLVLPGANNSEVGAGARFALGQIYFVI
jgi:hypothetical protein